MKLSEIKGERVFEVIAELVDPISEIAADDEVTELLRPRRTSDGKIDKDDVVEKVRRSIPKLMREHRDALCTILSTTQGVSKEDYVESLTMNKFMDDVFEILTDKDLVSFFG